MSEQTPVSVNNNEHPNDTGEKSLSSVAKDLLADESLDFEVADDFNTNPQGPTRGGWADGSMGSTRSNSYARTHREEGGASSVIASKQAIRRSGPVENESTASHRVKADGVTVGYSAREGDAHFPPAGPVEYPEDYASTTVVRKDSDGNEIYRHTSRDPKMAAKVGELAARKIREEASPNREDAQAA